MHVLALYMIYARVFVVLAWRYLKFIVVNGWTPDTQASPALLAYTCEQVPVAIHPVRTLGMGRSVCSGQVGQCSTGSPAWHCGFNQLWWLTCSPDMGQGQGRRPLETAGSMAECSAPPMTRCQHDALPTICIGGLCASGHGVHFKANTHEPNKKDEPLLTK